MEQMGPYGPFLYSFHVIFYVALYVAPISCCWIPASDINFFSTSLIKRVYVCAYHEKRHDTKKHLLPFKFSQFIASFFHPFSVVVKKSYLKEKTLCVSVWIAFLFIVMKYLWICFFFFLLLACVDVLEENRKRDNTDIFA